MKYKVNGQIVIAESIGDAIKLSDSDRLHQMAYKFAQMGNYFDRANSARSRYVLAKEDEIKLNEFYNYALQVYDQLKKEVETLKRINGDNERWVEPHENETADLLTDGIHNLYWAGNNFSKQGDRIRALAKKLDELLKAYQDYAGKRRLKRNDSEEVEDLATVDKTFLLTLTRKIITNIQSDNFSTAQTQAKELERYINNVSYADSVDDSNELENMLTNSKKLIINFSEAMSNSEEKRRYSELYQAIENICDKAEQEIRNAKNENKNPAKESIVDKLYRLESFLITQKNDAKNSSAKSKLEALAKEVHRCWDRNRKY